MLGVHSEAVKLWIVLVGSLVAAACSSADPVLGVRLIATGFSSNPESAVAGRIAVSEDGGVTWNMQEMGEGNEWLTEGYVFDGQRGYILGNNGGLYVTTDAGASFTRQSIAESTFLDAIFFQDAQRGYVAGGELYQITDDGGATWTDATPPGFYFDHFHFFPDGRGMGVEGFLAPQHGILWSTPDAGVTWEQTLVTAGGLRALAFVDELEGWAVGDAGQTVYTTDGGTSWSPIDRADVGTAPNLNDVRFAPGGVGFAVGSGGAVWRLRGFRNDPASAWEWASAGPYDLRAVWVHDDRIAVAVGYQEYTDHGVILRTRDGGRNWDVVFEADQTFFYGMVGPLLP